MEPTVVLVDDDPANGEYMASVLAGYRTHFFTDPRAALDFCSTTDFDILIADQKMPHLTGIELVRKLRDIRESFVALIVSGYTDAQDLVDAVNSNVIHKYIVKPFPPNALLAHVRRAQEHLRLERENRALETLLRENSARLVQENERLRGDGRSVLDLFVGHHPTLVSLKSLAAQYALSDRPVLLTGETGTGKELLARAIHALSPRHARPFIAINAASVPESLFESELFGFKRGAFTGADGPKSGLLTLANGGTLFLDEVGELQTQSQAKLLRVLQFGTFFPVGGTREESIDVRMISATNRDLRDQGSGDPFRADLFYRIATLELRIPPLREHPSDVLPLFRHIAATRCLVISRLLPEAEAVLASHPFPGNVRELEGIVERLHLHCAAHAIPLVSADLMREVVTGRPESARSSLTPATSLPVSLPFPPDAQLGLHGYIEKVERSLVETSLKENGYNLSRTARALGLSRQGLRNKMGRYRIGKGSGDAPIP